MVIGFDGKRAVCNTTGLGNYSRLIIDEVSRHFPEHQYKIYSPKADRDHRLDGLADRGNVSLHLPESAMMGKSVWRSVCGMSAQAERDGVEIFHGLSGELPLDVSKHAFKSVVTVHDLIFCHFPELYGFINTAIYKFKCRSACRAADRIVAVSECTKRDIVKFIGISPSKIDVVYQGCNPIFSMPISVDDVDRVRKSYSLPEKYLLNVGTIEERKNVLLIVKALEKLDDKDIPLIVIGRKMKYAMMVEDYARHHGLENRIRYLSDVPTADLPALYHMASIFIYPSRYEGFGIPIIEAQSCGAPVIAATGSCLEEAAGSGALMVHPDSVDGMIECINTILKDDTVKNDLIEKGYENIKRFGPSVVAQSMMSVYNRVLQS
ncbi:MAG: glycosyltransferase family 4 protein [Bacteroidales bacterium]|nr:glycosyltransferase family 4 protein [Bacteroidales bacterium]